MKALRVSCVSIFDVHFDNRTTRFQPAKNIRIFRDLTPSYKLQDRLQKYHQSQIGISKMMIVQSNPIRMELEMKIKIHIYVKGDYLE